MPSGAPLMAFRPKGIGEAFRSLHECSRTKISARAERVRAVLPGRSCSSGPWLARTLCVTTLPRAPRSTLVAGCHSALS